MPKIDIHVHTTTSSCSIFSPDDLVKLAVRMNLHAVVTTNHHNFTGDADFLREALEPEGILYFPAMEITNEWGDFLIFGEDIGDLNIYNHYFPKALLPRPDVAVVWAHPYRFMREREIDAIKWEVEPYIDAVEGINGNCLRSCRWANYKAVELASLLKKPVTAGSDAHSDDMFFMTWTEFEGPVNSYSDFVRRIKEGKVRMRR